MSESLPGLQVCGGSIICFDMAWTGHWPPATEFLYMETQ